MLNSTTVANPQPAPDMNVLSVIHYSLLKRTYTWVAITAYAVTLQTLLLVSTSSTVSFVENLPIFIIFTVGSIIAGLLTWLRQTNRQKEIASFRTLIPEDSTLETYQTKLKELNRIHDPQRRLPLLSLATGLYVVVGYNFITSNIMDSLNLAVAIVIGASVATLTTSIVYKTIKFNRKINKTT